MKSVCLSVCLSDKYSSPELLAQGTERATTRDKSSRQPAEETAIWLTLLILWILYIFCAFCEVVFEILYEMFRSERGILHC